MIAAQIAKDFAKIKHSFIKALPIMLVALMVVLPIALVLDQAVTGGAGAHGSNSEAPLPVVALGSLKDSSIIQRVRQLDTVTLSFVPSELVIEQAIRDQEARFGLLPSRDPEKVVMLTRSSSDASQLFQDARLPLSLSGDDTQFKVENLAGGSGYSSGPSIAWTILVTFIVLTNIISSFLVWEERSKGYLEELIASPASYISIMISKLASVMIAAWAIVIPIMVLGVIGTLAVGLTADEGGLSRSFAVFENINLRLALDIIFFALSMLFSIAIIAAILVILQITMRDRMVISVFQMILSVPLFFVPVIFPATAFEDTAWAWAVPVINVYADLAYAMINDFDGYSFMPMMAINAIATGILIALGSFLVSRIREWPAR